MQQAFAGQMGPQPYYGGMPAAYQPRPSNAAAWKGYQHPVEEKTNKMEEIRVFRQQSRGFDAGAFLWYLFAGTLLFALVAGFGCFKVRYVAPTWTFIVGLLACVYVLQLFVRGCLAKERTTRTKLLIAGFWVLVAFVSGICAGDYIYWTYLQPFYDVSNLQFYRNVDPSKMAGNQLMDAGKILFKEGSYVDLRKSMGFKNLDWYCVAPIVSVANQEQDYDFWAVGKNCCSGLSADFQCGEFNNMAAHSGLRLMRDYERPYFRLAVEQAVAAFSIKATHPLFFYWMQDPWAETNQYRDSGYQSYVLNVFIYFFLNLFFVILFLIMDSKKPWLAGTRLFRR